MNYGAVKTVAIRDFLAIVKTKSFLLGVLLFVVMIAAMPFMLLLVGLKEPVQLKVLDVHGEFGARMVGALERNAVPDRDDFMALLTGKNPALVSISAELLPVDIPATQAEIDRLQAGLDHELAARDIDGYVLIRPGEEEPIFTLRMGNLADQTPFHVVKDTAYALLRKWRAEQEGISWDTMQRVNRSFDMELEQLVKGEGRRIGLREFALGFVMPMFLVLGLFGLVSFQSERLLTLLIEERNKRLLEWLMVRLTAFELLLGKVLGALVLGVLLFSVVFAFLIAMAALLSYERLLNPFTAGAYAAFYIAGFLLYGGLYAAVGSVCRSMKEAENLALPLRLSLLIPLIATLHVSSAPHSLASVILSYIPMTAPFLMVNRMVVTDTAAWQVLLSLGLTLATAWYGLHVAGKVLETQSRGTAGRSPVKVLRDCLLLREP